MNNDPGQSSVPSRGGLTGWSAGWSAGQPFGRRALGRLAAGGGIFAASRAARAQDGIQPIRVGIMHSLSGPMAATETPLKDVLLMLIAERNRQGGVLARPVMPVVIDISDPALIAERTQTLFAGGQVCDAIFGGYSGASRQALHRAIADRNTMLFFPGPLSGQESRRRIIYTGGALNQRADPAMTYLLNEMKVQRCIILGDPENQGEEAAKVIAAGLAIRNVPENRLLMLQPPSDGQWTRIAQAMRRFASEGGEKDAGPLKTAAFSLLSGAQHVDFFRALAAEKISGADLPVLCLAAGEAEFAQTPSADLAGHLAAACYFPSLETQSSRTFIEQWRAFNKGRNRILCDAAEAHMLGMDLWFQAVQNCGTTAADRVLDALPGLAAPNLSGGYSVVSGSHYLSRPFLLAALQADGGLQIVSRSAGSLRPRPWTDALSATKDLDADWTQPLACGAYDVRNGKCLPEK